MLTLTHRLPPDPQAIAQATLSLTADNRIRSRHYFETDDGQGVYLQLPRGTVLHHGDLLASDAEDRLIRVVAKPEPVMTVTAATPLDLLRAAYHLGNRHVPLEVAVTHLRLSPDPVLKTMLKQMGLQVRDEQSPFQPEVGAYGHPGSHLHKADDHSHDPTHHHAYE